MEVRLFEDVEGESVPKDLPSDEKLAEVEIASTLQYSEDVKEQFSDDDCDLVESNTVVDLTGDGDEACNEERHSNSQPFGSLLSWLREFFESNLQTKLKNLINFTLCEHCKKPINDIFDMVFVEQYHLVCLFKFQLGQDLTEETVASIQMLKINLFEAFKSIQRARLLIKTRPQFCSFLESLKSEISERVCLSCGVTSDNVLLHARQTHTSKQDRYECRFCMDCFDYEYLQLRHEMQHPRLVKEKDSGMLLRNEQFLCPYCRIRFDDGQRMQEHQQAHEKAIKFHPFKALRTYHPTTVRASRKVVVKPEKDEFSRPYSLRCYANLRSRNKCKL